MHITQAWTGFCLFDVCVTMQVDVTVTLHTCIQEVQS